MPYPLSKTGQGQPAIILNVIHPRGGSPVMHRIAVLPTSLWKNIQGEICQFFKKIAATNVGPKPAGSCVSSCWAVDGLVFNGPQAWRLDGRTAGQLDSWTAGIDRVSHTRTQTRASPSGSSHSFPAGAAAAFTTHGFIGDASGARGLQPPPVIH